MAVHCRGHDTVTSGAVFCWLRRLSTVSSRPRILRGGRLSVAQGLPLLRLQHVTAPEEYDGATTLDPVGQADSYGRCGFCAIAPAIYPVGRRMQADWLHANTWGCNADAGPGANACHTRACT
jgi:hypothetical protein